MDDFNQNSERVSKHIIVGRQIEVMNKRTGRIEALRCDHRDYKNDKYWIILPPDQTCYIMDKEYLDGEWVMPTI